MISAVAALLLAACLDSPPGATVIVDAAADVDAAAGSSLLAAFRFEPGGFLMDSSGNGHDGVCSGITCPTEDVGALGNGQAALFDGVDDLVSIESVGSGAFTVMAWVRVDQSRDGALGCPVNKPLGVEGGDTWQLCLLVPSSGVCRIAFYASEPPILSKDVAMDIATWHHVAISWDLATKKIFWDGVEVAAQAGATEFDDSTIRLGSDMDGAEPISLFPGALDDLELHDGALDDEEIAAAAGR